MDMDAELRVGINTLAFAPGHSGGDGTYIQYLVRALSAGGGACRWCQALPHPPGCAGARGGNDAPGCSGAPACQATDQEPTQAARTHYLVFAAPWNAAALEPLGPHATLVRCAVPGRSFALRALWEHLMLPRVAEQAGLDVLHAPVNVAPLGAFGAPGRAPGRAGTPCRLVLTLHDVSPYLPGTRLPPALYLYWRFVRSASARQAAVVIAVSHASAAQVVRRMGVVPQKLRVIHHGVAPIYLEPDPAGPAQEPPLPGLAPGYLLWVGRPYPSKNLAVLLQALHLLRDRDPSWRHTPLVLVGCAGWDERRVAALVRRLGLREQVVRVGHSNERLLRRLYRHAAALVLPSTEEAFGLPVLEAMACGTLVVASRLESIVEVAGDTPLYVAPQDAAGWAAALAAARAAWRTQPPAYHARLARGRARAETFCWARTAAATARVYAAVAAGG